jgi:5-(carboxyamino)imidazole ribonucleotide synthase
MNSKYLGIIGGGQLGMFTCIAAKKRGLKTLVFSDSSEFSAKRFCDEYITGDFNDLEKVDLFAKKADFFTIETENIPLKTLKLIENEKKIYPTSNIVRICQNRLQEKKFINSIKGIKTTDYYELNNFKEFEEKAESLNFRCILKSKESGYDGKGQHRINRENLKEFKNIYFNDYILEKFVYFEKEISVIIVRGNNQIINYPPVENVHKKSILRESFYPAEISKEIASHSVELAKIIAKEINLNGVLAVEMFVLKDSEVIINELAPRPHNSGHWSMDACNESQYDNLIKVICNDNLEIPIISNKCKMVNLIGDDYNKISELKEKYKCYDYFKKEIRNLRKMGHYIILE